METLLMGPIRPWLFLFAFALLLGCGGSGDLPSPPPTDDDDGGLDDDDSAVDDDDMADDDDIVPDDDDIVPDDDDIVPDDDDIVPDDDDFWPDDDDFWPDDDDAVPPPCPSAGVLDCGMGVASNNGGGATDLDWYSCVGGGVTGPEVTFSIEPMTTVDYVISLTGLSDDLDLYLLAGDQCDGAACIGGSWNSGSNDEELEFEGEAGESYVLAVDGWAGAVSDFVLEVSCEPGDDDDAAPDDDDAAPDDDDLIFPDDDDAAPDDDDLIFPDDDDITGVDNDLDGYTDIDDCDDNDPLIHPGAPEVCDTVDNDCSGSVDDNGACSGCVQAEYGGHTYQFCPGSGGMSWTGARDICVAYGYYLVTINDVGEQDFVATQATALAAGPLWIGYNDRGWGNEGIFTWTAGNGSGYEAWNSGEPNSSGNEDCAEMRDTAGWLWNDTSCFGNNAWICELD